MHAKIQLQETILKGMQLYATTFSGYEVKTFAVSCTCHILPGRGHH
jgi:hypothetical protein